MPLLRAWSRNILIAVIYSLRAGIVSHPGTREFLWVLLTWHQQGGLVLNICVMNTFHLIHSLILPEKCINHLGAGCCKYSHNSLWPLLSSLHNFPPWVQPPPRSFLLGPIPPPIWISHRCLKSNRCELELSLLPHPPTPKPHTSGLLPEFLVWADLWLVL